MTLSLVWCRSESRDVNQQGTQRHLVASGRWLSDQRSVSAFWPVSDFIFIHQWMVYYYYYNTHMSTHTSTFNYSRPLIIHRCLSGWNERKLEGLKRCFGFRRKLATANRSRVGIRVTKIWSRSRGRGLSCKLFLSSRFVTMQNSGAASCTECAHVGSPKYSNDTGATPPYDGRRIWAAWAYVGRTVTTEALAAGRLIVQ